jgi:hypothetical protein
VATCTACPVNTYFSGTGGTNSTVCVPCPNFASSYEGSKVATSCICNPGYSGANGGTCTACGTGVWCLNGVSNTCPNNANSAALSSTLAACLCNAGYFGDTTVPTLQSATLCQVISSFFLSGLTPHTLYPLKILFWVPG